MKLAQEEFEFIKYHVSLLQEENESMGGIFLPLLFTNEGLQARMIRAKQIWTKRPPYHTCFVCLTENGRYNGFFVSMDQTELDKEGFLTIQYLRLRANIVFNVIETFEDGSVNLEFTIKHDEEFLTNLFDIYHAIYVKNKDGLIRDIGSRS